MRVLFTTLPAPGHARPLCAVAEELARRGHEVRWVAHDALAPHLLPAGAARHGYAGAGPEQAASVRARPTAAFRDYFDRLLVGASEQLWPAVRDAVASDRPDVVVVEQNCLAGAAGALVAGVPWVSVHVTPMLLTRPWRVLPMLEDLVDRRVAAFFLAVGAEPLPWPLRSPHGTVIPSSRTFLGPQADLRDGDSLVGALIATTRGAAPAPRHRVVIHLGTLTGSAGRAFLERAARAAVAHGPVLVVADTPLDLPDGARHERWAPLPERIAAADLLVGHGGQGSVNEALVAGVPMVLAPVSFDQPVVAARVEALGAGVVASLDRSTEEELRTLIGRVLGDPGYARAAREVGATLGDGRARAADLVEAAAR